MSILTHQDNTEGSKYQQVKNLDIKEIAKLIRNDLKKFKDCKFSVSIQRYAGGRSVHIKLMNCSTISKFVKIDRDNDYLSLSFSKDFAKKIDEIVNQYNFDKSHAMSDYFHVNFYSHINIDHNFEKLIYDKVNTVVKAFDYFRKDN